MKLATANKHHFLVTGMMTLHAQMLGLSCWRARKSLTPSSSPHSRTMKWPAAGSTQNKPKDTGEHCIV